MKDFDEGRIAPASDRTFRIGGETFVRKATVRPEALLGWDGITPESKSTETLKVVDQLISDFVTEPAKWRELRQREEDPVSLQDMMKIVEWLIAGVTGFPTTAPSPSGPGSVPIPVGANSTAISPSPVSIPTPSLSGDFSGPPTS